MALPVPPIDLSTGMLRSYTTAEVASMAIDIRGTKDGMHPSGKRSPQDCTISRPFFCDGAALEAFICYMTGAAVIYTDGTGDAQISRLLPQFFPGKTQSVATEIMDYRGFQYQGGLDPVLELPEYAKWDVDVGYQAVAYQLVDDTDMIGQPEFKRYLIELPSTVSPDYITLPGGVLQFVNAGGARPNGAQIQHNVGYVNNAVQIKKKWLKIPYAGWSANSLLRTRVFGNIEGGVNPWLGTINARNIFGYAPGQLLFTGVEDELVFDLSGEVQYWNLTYTWLARSISHDWFRFFDPTGGATGWYFVSNNGTFYDTNVLPDGTSLFNARDHFGLYAVGTYTNAPGT